MTQQHDGPSLLPCNYCGGTGQIAVTTPADAPSAGWADCPRCTRPTQPQADDRAEIVRWLRAQSDKGAEVGIAAGKETTRRAAFGGGSLALHRAADAIERGEHLIDNIADRLANGETESQQPQAEGLDDLIRRVEYILDPSASASERTHRRSHLTNHDLRCILRALRSPEPSEGWMPIETAPKHWVPVLVWALSEGEREDAEDEDREPERSAMVAEHSDIQPGRWWLTGTMQRVYDPTHWRPLPAPPSLSLPDR